MAPFNAKKLANLFTFVFLFLSLGFGQQSSAQNLSVKGKIENPYLFALEKDGRVSFLFGTMHVPVEENQFPRYLIEALESKPVFFGERDISKAFGIRKQSNKNSEEIIRGFEKEGIPRKYVEFTDVNQLCRLYTEWDFVTNGNQNKLMDGFLQVAAKENNKQFFELDTDKDLLKRAFSEINSKPCDEDVLKNLIRFPRRRITTVMLDKYQKYFDSYKNGNIELLTDRDEVESTLLRNELWVTALMEKHNLGFFAAVGAQHLAPGNPRGLLPLLEKEGFKITRISDQRSYQNLLRKYQPAIQHRRSVGQR